jgi:hypothetical protein
MYTDREKEKILQTDALDVLQTEDHRINQIDPDTDLVITDIDFEDI